MAERPAYLPGQGRGRGKNAPANNVRPNLGRGGQPRQTVSMTQPKPSLPKHKKDVTNGRMGSGSQDKFRDAASRHQMAALQHLTSTGGEDLSSDEEDDLDDEQILNAVLKTFSNTSAEIGPNELGRTESYLANSVKAKANVCLICIETVRRTDPIWCCVGCHTMFHIACIQKWVKDGVYQAILQADDQPRKDLPWNCPKCRFEYQQHQCPTKYYCFCGKVQDPAVDPWLVPHSCGQVCNKKLKPECGHMCLLLCHPGPCPPCPKTVRVSCFCKQQPASVRRCGTQDWSCGQPCRKPLSCGQHKCQKPCHEGECPPCPEKSIQKCQCGKNSAVKPCAEPVWQCEQVCGQPLNCGQHKCERVCHTGRCGGCPRAGNRSCPCGKSEFKLPCTADVPTCSDTCGKKLECGKHTCNQRCHYGPCGACRDMIVKKCRCGRKEKEIQCYKEFTCDTKCNKIKDCGKHSCKKKCCDGQCPPCDLPCGKFLSCRNHKCSSRCHQGQCYPCPLVVKLSCSCGGTMITVPCGGEKFTKPPRCKIRCLKPPDCRHENRDPHKCHFGNCPPCRQVCGLTLQCGHTCPAVCHIAVLMKIQEKVQRAGPWEAQPQARLELRDFPCPPCKVSVQTTCLGKHEVFSMPCSEVSVTSCHRPCGRSLACGNHRCEMECHTVEEAPDDQSAGSNCQKCEEACSKPRPEGCGHPCLLPCHQGLCPPCSQMIRMRCHCQQLVLHIECDQWTHADDTERGRLRSCQSKCPKLLKCKHKCQALCHPGSCPDPERCVEKVNVRCPCKRKKRNFLCNEVQAGYGKVECDESCQQYKATQKEEHAQKNQAAIDAAKRKEEEEIEAYKRKLEPRKRRTRKQKQEVEQPSLMQRYAKIVVAPLLVIMLAVFVYCLLNTST